ncbi:MAG: ribonuclease R [bacterium]|nr:ribonuclease R [bacterium]
MTRKEKIYAYMTSDTYVPLRFDELMAVLDVPAEDGDELAVILDELINSGKILITKKQRYMPVTRSDMIEAGVLKCNAKGYFGFLICDDANEADIFIHGDNMGDALHGDHVLVKIDRNSNDNGRREGHIIKVTERANTNIIGVISKFKDGLYRLRPDDRRIYKGVRISPEDMGGADVGDRVCAEITDISAAGKLHGRVLMLLGDSDSLKSRIEGIILSNNIKQEFDPETITSAESMPDKITEGDLKDRTDFRDKLIFTIDGDDARDFDDAVSLEILENGNYYLGVHIADVTNYVREGEPLDTEAFERGTSVYLADRVIPMLPTKLSNGICSLNPNEDRLTLSVMMEINQRGEVISHSLLKSVINSKYRMTYSKASAIIERTDAQLTEEYAPIVRTLDIMQELSEILIKKRCKRGAIDFDFPETYIEVDEDGEPISIGRAERGVSHRLIESFMLCANETVAEYAFWSELPFVYRVHEAPSTDKLTAFNRFIRPFNLYIKERIDGDEPIHPKALQEILDSVKGTAEERMVSLEMLHSLMKAAYSDENKGHFGLAAKYYCHFTSPIRRYPDLMIHRILKEFLDGRLIDDELRHFKAIVYEAAAKSSEREVAAEHTERDVDDLMKTAYMSNHIGEEFEAVIANITGFGMFVELPNTVEGLIRIENMHEDYFEFDEDASILRGIHSGISYKTGDAIQAVLVNTEIETSRIDFVLAQDMYPGIYKQFKKAEKPREDKKKKRGMRKPGKPGHKRGRTRNYRHGK